MFSNSVPSQDPKPFRPEIHLVQGEKLRDQKQEFQVIPVPGDGGCLFSSMAVAAMSMTAERKMDLSRNRNQMALFKALKQSEVADQQDREVAAEIKRLKAMLRGVREDAGEVSDFFQYFNDEIQGLTRPGSPRAVQVKMAAWMYILGAAFRSIRAAANPALRDPTAWGDNLDAHNVGAILGCNVRIFSASMELKETTTNNTGLRLPTGAPTVSIRHTGNHYNYLSIPGEPLTARLPPQRTVGSGAAPPLKKTTPPVWVRPQWPVKKADDINVAEIAEWKTKANSITEFFKITDVKEEKDIAKRVVVYRFSDKSKIYIKQTDAEELDASMARQLHNMTDEQFNEALKKFKP